MRIYLDNAATTPLSDEVLNAMIPFLKNSYGNPSSTHQEGRTARAAIEKTRKIVADAIGASTAEIVFTSGGTEANNMAIKCAVRDLGVRRIISSPIEHSCVFNTVNRLCAENITVEYVELTPCGKANLEHLETLLAAGDQKTLVYIDGGGQERQMRSGTENVASILGLGVALKTAVDELEERRQHIDMIRDYFVEQLRENFLGIRLNGNHEKQQYLFTVLNVAFPTTLPVNLLLFKLDLGGISASGGSACNSGAVSKSRVLQQFDIPSEYQSVRFSFSHYNTKAEIDQTIIILKKTLGNT